MLYNFGGNYANHSVYWLDLLNTSQKWKSVEVIGDLRFKRWEFRDAATLGDKIVYFGKAFEWRTFSFEQEEGSNKLCYCKTLQSLDYCRGWRNSTFCTFKDKIFYFPTDNFSHVYYFDLKAEKPFRYFWRKLIIYKLSVIKL